MAFKWSSFEVQNGKTNHETLLQIENSRKLLKTRPNKKKKKVGKLNNGNK